MNAKFEIGKVYYHNWFYDGGYTQGYRFYKCIKFTKTQAVFELVDNIYYQDFKGVSKGLVDHEILRGKIRHGYLDDNDEYIIFGDYHEHALWAENTYEKYLEKEHKFF